LFLPAVILAISLVPSLRGQSISFNAPRDYLVETDPNSVVIGDFNGDGRPDIATASDSANDVSVLLQNSDGTFRTAVNYPQGHQPSHLQVGDVNNDGKLDLMLINFQDQTLAVVLGNGDGTFQNPILTHIVGAPVFSAEFIVGDFNHDGDLDVAVEVSLPQAGAFAAAILLGNGDGTFQPPVNYSIPNGVASLLEAADVNGDGKLDLVGATFAGISVLLGNGDGTFQSAIAGSSVVASSLALADFNQDGKLDIALQNTETETLQVLLGNGNGTFQSGMTIPPSAFRDILGVGDLNGDGKADLIGQGSLGGVQILLGNGDGTFTMKPPLATVGQQTVILGDLNGDGIPDIVVAAAGTHRSDTTFPDIVSVVMGNGDGTFAIAPTYALPQFPGSVIAADLNNDGKADLVAAFFAAHSDEGGFATLLNLGTSFDAPVVTSVIPPLFPLSLVAADFNGDGRIDLACTNLAVGIFLGNGDGTLQPGVFYDQGTQAPTAVGDFNGDGVPDIVGFNEASFDVSALLGNGDGTFGFALNSPAGGFVSALAVGDFNGDGKLDVATIVSPNNGPSVASLLLGEGNGSFALQPTMYNVGPSASTIAAGDLNGDGIPDLVIGNGDGFDGPSTVVVLLGLGGGAFAAPITTSVGNGISSIVTGDFNLDGKTDVAVSNSLWNDVSVLLGNGDGTFQPAVNFGLVGGAGLTAADFNGDGSLDLAAVNAGPAALSVLYSGASGAAALTSPSSLIFGNQGVGYASPTQNVSLTNSGSAPLRISAIAISGAQSGDYQQSNSCGATLAAAAHCTINVTFTPSAAGMRTAAIQITDNAFNSPQSISLHGTAATPSAMASVAPASLSFGNQFVGSSSAAQAITISSTGNIPLTIGSVSLSGAQGSDFSQTSSTCGSTLSQGSSCTVSINFTPAALGGGAASLTVADNAAGSPQVTSLSGTGVAQSIGLGIQPGGSNSATVTAGQTATYTLSIGGEGLTGTASLTCTGAPAGAVCTIPATKNFSGSAATTFTVSVSTTSRMAETRPGPSATHIPWAWATLIMGWLVVPCGRVRKSAKKQSIRRLPLLPLLVLFLISCGGSGSGGSSPGGTVPATYDLQVTATSGTTSQSTSLSLTVR
jgi:hypothetical protein